MRYRKDYQETHDIDWFFRYKGKVYHAASNGGLLPDKVDSEKNRIIQEKLEDIVGVFAVVYTGKKDTLYSQDADLSSFRDYASKGFISLDRTEKAKEGNKDVPEYHVVAFPANNNVYNNPELVNLMPILTEKDIVITE